LKQSGFNSNKIKYKCTFIATVQHLNESATMMANGVRHMNFLFLNTNSVQNIKIPATTSTSYISVVDNQKIQPSSIPLPSQLCNYLK